MVNYAILTDYKDKFVGVIAQDYRLGKIFYKVINKYIDSLLENIFQTKFYHEIEDEEIEYLEEVKKTDKDYLETVLPSFEDYKVKEFYEECDVNYKKVVNENFQNNVLN